MINDAINIPPEVIICLVALIIHPHNRFHCKITIIIIIERHFLYNFFCTSYCTSHVYDCVVVKKST